MTQAIARKASTKADAEYRRLLRGQIGFYLLMLSPAIATVLVVIVTCIAIVWWR